MVVVVVGGSVVVDVVVVVVGAVVEVVLVDVVVGAVVEVVELVLVEVVELVVVLLVLVVVVGRPTARVCTIVPTLSPRRRAHVLAVTSLDAPVNVNPITRPSEVHSAMHEVRRPATR